MSPAASHVSQKRDAAPTGGESAELEPDDRVRALFAEMPQYRYEHIIIDNSSTDGTVAELREIAARDKNVKVMSDLFSGK